MYEIEKNVVKPRDPGPFGIEQYLWHYKYVM